MNEMTEPEGSNRDRTFTQAEVDAIVKERLARQRAQLDKGDHTAELEGLRTTLDNYRSSVAGTLAERKRGLPSGVCALLEKLEPLEQLEWLTTNGGALASAPPAGVTPSPKPQAGPLPAELVREKANDPMYSI